jgi:ubiquitin-protein ligase
VGDIEVYITITLSKTFVISINFTKYPKKPIILVPNEVKNILGPPNISLETLKKWNPKTPKHIVDILHELEKKLFFIKEVEFQYKKLSGEYQCDVVSDSLTFIKVHLLTYGFTEFLLEVDLEPYPKVPKINLSSALQQIIDIPIAELNSYRNWRENESDTVEIIREISWLVDKNSRINFEIDLLKDHYKNIKYDPSTTTLNMEMKGKMKTEDLTFEFQIKLPVEYPMKMPEVKVLNEFELETHEKIKNDLHASFDDFFDEWTPFSYLVDLFNLISKKIFEVSVVSCVICHKIECPSCAKRIAGEEYCHAECPHCNRAYHHHCWEQTIQSFGKCGFCLR